ncbi:MAG: ricin-type beta-trefoil lectin domain protein [Candidatus Saccharibacteria bacterium]|nr:ricin-type beta-trefoil lectin domain protein [Candidatus Saccharibacteria bacterium]
MRRLRQPPGFTLPSVIIASVLMMVLLTAALQIAAASSHALREQYYNQLAREAAESGIVRARACIKKGLRAPWRDGKSHNLFPNVSCEGANATTSHAYYATIGTKPRIGLRYKVGSVTRYAATGQQVFAVTGYADILRTTKDGSNNDVIVKTYTFSNIGQINALGLTSKVGMGYYSYTDNNKTIVESYATRIGEDGRVKSFGGNRYGQLGNGKRTSSATSVDFGTVADVEKVYTNRLSAGTAIFAITKNGEIYAAGDNRSGQLGHPPGQDNQYITRPRKITLPTDWRAQKVMSTSHNTFILADKVDGTTGLFSLGKCHESGLLGRSCGGGELKDTPEKIDLGGGVQPYIDNSGDSAVQEMAADDRSAMVIGKDGHVYGWGNNDHGQLGIGGNDVFSKKVPTPKRVNSYTSAGVDVSEQINGSTTRIKSIATDGLTFYLLRNDGRLFVSGDNTFGQLGEFAYDGSKEKFLSASQLRLSNYDEHHCLRAEYHAGEERFIADFDNCYTGGSTTNNPNLEIVFSGSNEITLKSRSAGSPSHGLSNGSNGLCLDVSSGVTTFKSCAGQSATQRWRIETAAAGAVTLRSASEQSKCLAAAKGNDPRSGRVRVRNCNEAKGNEEKNFHFFIANPFMNELNLLNNKQVNSAGFINTANSVRAVSTDNRSVTFIAKEYPSDGYVVKSLGYNSRGMFGDNRQKCKHCNRPVQFALPSNDNIPHKILNVAFASSSAGGLDRYNNLYVITANGNAYGAGSNYFGQLGRAYAPTNGCWAGNHNGHGGPQDDCWFSGTGAQTKEGFVKLDNWYDDTLSRTTTPPQVVDIAAGGGAIMLFTNDGRIYTVGNNNVGQLGSGNQSPPWSSKIAPRPNFSGVQRPPLFY